MAPMARIFGYSSREGAKERVIDAATPMMP